MEEIQEKIKKLSDKRYPQNFLIRKPFIGALIFFAFIFCFVVIYQPLHVHEARSFSFDYTMLLYCATIAVFVLILLLILDRVHFFSENSEWTILKEFLLDVIILAGIGLSAYLAGFIIEEPVPRWNFPTFFDSLQRALLLGIIPVFFFTILNIRYLFVPETSRDFTSGKCASEKEDVQKQIHIISRAKKEELSFCPEQFIYAESLGNYVRFHLIVDEKPREEIIRNSISNIELQLSEFPCFMRIHRAFIININKVTSKSGNSLGYRLKLAGSDNIIPVSRQNTRDFEQAMK